MGSEMCIRDSEWIIRSDTKEKLERVPFPKFGDTYEFRPEEQDVLIEKYGELVTVCYFHDGSPAGVDCGWDY